MSTARGDSGRTRPPKYQNKFSFKHNKASKKTEAILAAPNAGLCKRCHDQVEWRKKYRKYKPLTRPAKCVACKLPRVKLAYHCLCTECYRKEGVCAKCRQMSQYAELRGLSERDRRSALREFEKEELAEKEARRQERRAAQGLPNDTEEARLKVEEEALARAKARKKNDSDNEIEEEYEESDSEGEDGEIEEED